MKNNIYFFKKNFYFIAFLIVYSSNIHSQTLTAEQIYQKVTDAVVVVHAYNYNDELVKQGSGVVLNDKGYVVTNYHVLSGCERLEIMHNKEVVPYVDIIGIDVEKDILILKIEAKKFPAIKIGDSEKLIIGQRVYAIGSPLGFENTISEGIISGLRNYKESQKNFIQITASISSGSSGGAVVNDKGELIGISTLTAKEGQNLNFAIPIDEVLTVEIGSYLNNDTYKDFEWFSKGNNALLKGDFQNAIKYYTNYLKKYPNDAAAYHDRGLAKHHLGDYISSIQDFNKSIEINPYDETTYLNRGNSKCELNDIRGAIQDYDKAIEIYPTAPFLYFNRGIAKYDLEDYKGAIQDFTREIENYPNNFKAYHNRGRTKNDLEDYKGAIQDFNKAIEINPNIAATYYSRGISKYNLGDKYGACQDWSKAGELGNGTAYDMIRENCN